MRAKKFIPALLAAVLVSASGWSLAAEDGTSTQQHQQSAQNMKTTPGMSGQMMGNMGGNGMMGNGMMGGGMMSAMMGMMGGSMMGGGATMGRLPAGNAPLAMRMHGEMMEAVGNILIKYADKLPLQAATQPAK